MLWPLQPSGNIFILPKILMETRSKRREKALKEMYEADTEEEDSSESKTGGVRAIPGEGWRTFVNGVEIGENEDPWEEYDRQTAEINRRKIEDMQNHFLRLLEGREELKPCYAAREAESSTLKRKHNSDPSGMSNVSKQFNTLTSTNI